MSVISGQRLVSIRKRMLAYCEQQGIRVPASFHAQDTVYPIAVVDLTDAEQPRLLGETFYNGKSVLRHLEDQNKNPANFRALDFKRGRELLLAVSGMPVLGAAFDRRRDVDVLR